MKKNGITGTTISLQEMVWVNKMNANIRKAGKLTIRPEFFRAVVDLYQGNIDFTEFRKVNLRTLQLLNF